MSSLSRMTSPFPGTHRLSVPLVALAFALMLASAPLYGCKAAPEEAGQQPAKEDVEPADDTSTTEHEEDGDAASPEQKQDEAPAQTEDTTEDESPSVDEAQPLRDYTAVEQAINQAITGYENVVSVVYLPLDDPAGGVRVSDSVQMRSASMIKVPILATLLKQVEEGTLSLQDTHELQWSEIVGGTGAIQGYPAGSVFTVDQLAWHMIAESDNVATNILIDLVGMDAINQNMLDLDLQQTVLQRKMMDYDAIARGEDNYTCAADLARLYLLIGKGELVSAEQSERALGYLKDQTDRQGIAQGLPEGIVFAHKTGVLEDVRHDGGIVYADNPYVLVVMAQLSQPSADALSAEVSRAVWEAHQALE